MKVHSNLKIMPVLPKAKGVCEAYAKVIRIDDSDSSIIKAMVEFTWLSEDMKALLPEEGYGV